MRLVTVCVCRHRPQRRAVAAVRLPAAGGRPRGSGALAVPGLVARRLPVHAARQGLRRLPVDSLDQLRQVLVSLWPLCCQNTSKSNSHNFYVVLVAFT